VAGKTQRGEKTSLGGSLSWDSKETGGGEPRKGEKNQGVPRVNGDMKRLTETEGLGGLETLLDSGTRPPRKSHGGRGKWGDLSKRS